MNIDGTSALVVGGASGLGEAVAVLLAEQNARTVIVDRDGERADRTAGAIGAKAYRADITDSNELQIALANICESQGAPRIAVICAGIGDAARTVGRDGPLPLEAFEKVVRVNLFGTFNVVRLVAAEMAKLEPQESGERGVVIMTASVAAFDGQIGQAAYSASKGGVVSMTLPLAREFARMGIRVVTVAPGIFRTPLLGTLPEEAQEALAASIPFPPRLGEPSEFAELVASCIRNQFLNGEVIRLDGAVRLAAR